MGPGACKSNQRTQTLSRHLLSDGLRPPNTEASSSVRTTVLAYRLRQFYDEPCFPRPNPRERNTLSTHYKIALSLKNLLL
jgi:hypothetical protein